MRKKVGDWILGDLLGAGGNAKVWRARGKSGEDMALKILNRPRGERYQRFRHEVALLERLGERPGLLPLVDCHLPSSPTQGDPAWLAMPIAQSLKDHLGDERALEEVVSAVHEIAVTLAALAGEGIGHRDIKPTNLYWHNGRAVVGDFGLADFPGKDSITVEGRRLGPQYYIAPEMLSDAAKASPHPADVYSLAKTLWVLATGQNYPPPGEQRRDTSAVMLSTYIDHPRAHLLDGLIEDATRYDPGMRPDMNTFAADLEAWLAPPGPEAVGPDVSDLGQRIVSIIEREQLQQQEAHRPLAQATALNQRFFEQVAVVGKEFRDAGFPVLEVATTTLWDIFGKGRLTGHGRLVYGGCGGRKLDRPSLTRHLASRACNRLGDAETRSAR
jgi:serine/threonine protein kinase